MAFLFINFYCLQKNRNIFSWPIYAVKADGGVTVKYVEFDEKNGLLVLVSENPEYNAEIIRMDKGKAFHDYVVGRVAWIGRALG